VESTAEGQVKALAAAAADELGETLDEELGSTVRDHAIFNEHARKYEREFMEDLELLGVRPPDVLTRVTECVTLLCVIVPLLASSFY
jgi:cysteinyl-tRNA synthetase